MIFELLGYCKSKRMKKFFNPWYLKLDESKQLRSNIKQSIKIRTFSLLKFHFGTVVQKSADWAWRSHKFWLRHIDWGWTQLVFGCSLCRVFSVPRISWAELANSYPFGSLVLVGVDDSVGGEVLGFDSVGGHELLDEVGVLEGHWIDTA